MVAITKPNMTRVWAEGAPGSNVEDPDVTSPGKFDAGWVAEIPPFENFNYLQQLFSQSSAYINENGVGEWDEDTNYAIQGIVRGSDDKFYQSLIADNTGNDPISSPTQWKQLVFISEWNTDAIYDSRDIVVLNGIIYKSLTDANTGNNPVGDIINWLSSSTASFSENLTSLIHADASRGYQDLYKQGITPAGHNQQWGGAGYGGLPDGSLGEVATGYIVADTTENIAEVVGNTYQAQGFKVGQNTDLASVWIKTYKVGNPTNNLELRIYSDAAGSPSAVIANGTATAQNGRLHSDNPDGAWVKFTFPVAPSLVASTQYHIVVNSSGAVDAVNFWKWARHSVSLYPNGSKNTGNATPTWVPDTTALSFLVEPVTTILQAGGLHGDGKIVPYEGSPLDQSGAFNLPNHYADINHEKGTFLIAGTGFTASKTLLDSGTGVDNNRVRLSIDGSGFPVVELWEADGTKHTVTGTTDVQTGNHIIGFAYQAKNDGTDFLKLLVNENSEGVPITAASILLDESFSFAGNTILGGGFPTAPVWTDDEDMSVLPSASGWTWTGTELENNAMSVNGGVLYQNGAGYTTTTGYYEKTTTLNNATGWIFETKVKIKNGNNVSQSSSNVISIKDGSKRIEVELQEYYMDVWHGVYKTVQIDLTKETIIRIIGKGSNFYIYAGSILIYDGTGLLTAVTATNSILFGDLSPTAGNNSTAEWHYIKYYEGAFLPEYQACEISEIAYWSADKSALFPTIYNAGTIQSVKQLAGMDRNYVREVERVIEVRGIVSDPNTTSITEVPLDDMRLFIFGEHISIDSSIVVTSSAPAEWVGVGINLNGDYSAETDRRATYVAAAGHTFAISANKSKKENSSLNYAEILWRTSNVLYTATNPNKERNMTVEAE